MIQTLRLSTFLPFDPSKLMCRVLRPLFRCLSLGIGTLTVLSVFNHDLVAQNTGVTREVGLLPTIAAEMPTRDLDAQPGAFNLSLAPFFALGNADPAQLVLFKTSLGSFAAELLAADAPATVTNFRSYLATATTSANDRLKTYDGTFIHRAAENRDDLGQLVSEFVIQGGGYRANNSLGALEKKPTVVNEFKVANTRGTFAMAKIGGNPPTTATINSATNEWFINLSDNRSNLDNQNGGFTVFARMLGRGMEIADAIAALPTYNLGGVFTELPLRNVQSGQTQVQLSNLVAVDSIRATPLHPPADGSPSILTYTVTSDNPRVATATVAKGGILQVKPAAFGGRARLTVRATEPAGGFVEGVLTVTRSGAPRILTQMAATTRATLGQPAVLQAAVAAWPLNVRWQTRASATAAWEDIAPSATYAVENLTTLRIALPATNPTQASASLSFNNRQYRYIVANELGGISRSVESQVTTLLVEPRLAFVKSPPLSVTGKIGEITSFTAEPDPASLPEPTLQWQRLTPGSNTWENLVDSSALSPTLFNGVNTPLLVVRLNQTGELAVAARALDKTQFRCVLTQNRGTGTFTVITKPSTLRVTVPPVSITTQPPVTVSAAPGTTASLTLSTASVPASIPLTYRWQRRAAGSNDWTNLVESTTTAPTRYSGVSTRTLTLSLAATNDAERLAVLGLAGDEFRCVVSNVLETVVSRASRLVVLAGVFQPVTAENQLLPGLVAANGRTFAAAGLPAGLSMDASTGRISGTPRGRVGEYNLTITIRTPAATAGAPALVETKTYVIEHRLLDPSLATGYEAFLVVGDAPPSGKIALRIAGNGTFTGALVTRDDTAIPLKGSVVRDPATGALGLSAPLVIKRPGTPTGRTYSLDFDLTSAGTFTATLTQPAAAGSPAVTYTLDRAVKLATYGPSAVAPWATSSAAYTLAFTPPTTLDNQPSPTLLPQGSGYATATLANTGLLTLRGKTADGGLITAALPTDANADYRLFIQPVGGQTGAWFSAFLPLSANTSFKPGSTSEFYSRYAIATDDGKEVYWQKPASTRAVNYRAGFAPVGLTVRMEPWNANNYTQIGIITTTDRTKGRTDLVLSGAALSNAAPNEGGLPVNLSLTYSTGAMVKLSGADPTKLTLRVNTATGLVSGALTLPRTGTVPARAVQIEGVFFTKASNTPVTGDITAEGYALVNVPGGTPLSARFQLRQPAP